MDEYTARRLADALNVHGESFRWLPERIERMERAAERMEWAIQEATRQNDRLEEIVQRMEATR